LTMIIDLYSRKVISHQLAKTLSSSELIYLIKETYQIRNQPKGLIFHSDQGKQYTVKAFKSYLKQNNKTQSFLVKIVHTIILLLRVSFRVSRRKKYIDTSTIAMIT